MRLHAKVSSNPTNEDLQLILPEDIMNIIPKKVQPRTKLNPAKEKMMS